MIDPTVQPNARSASIPSVRGDPGGAYQRWVSTANSSISPSTSQDLARTTAAMVATTARRRGDPGVTPVTASSRLF